MKNVASGRIEVIDVLRGFALLGILLVHASGEFAGWSAIYISPVNPQSLSTARLDDATNLFLNIFLINKSRALFAFLFGVSFFYQLDKANRQGYKIEGKFARRMLMLFLIGVLHAYLIWAGDIFRIYAICGILLLFVYKWQPKKLLITGIFFTVLVPALNSIIRFYLPYSSLTDSSKIEMYQYFAGDSYASLLHANLLRDAAVNLDPYMAGSYLLVVFGNFVLGYWAAKTGFFNKLSADKKLLYTYLSASFVAGLLCSLQAIRGVCRLVGTSEDALPALVRNALNLLYSFSQEAMALFLLCTVVLLYRRPFWQKKLSVLKYAGRMTLTNYLMQSVFAALFFFGAGLGYISHFGPAIAFVMAIFYFVFQVWYSRQWLQYFTMGPMEFLWRSLIEGKWQRIRKPAVSLVTI